MKAVEQLGNVIYGEAVTQTKYFLENRFDSDDFTELPEVQLNEMGKEFEGLTNLPIEFSK